jgi:hypothetical protein
VTKDALAKSKTGATKVRADHAAQSTRHCAAFRAFVELDRGAILPGASR